MGYRGIIGSYKWEPYVMEVPGKFQKISKVLMTFWGSQRVSGNVISEGAKGLKRASEESEVRRRIQGCFSESQRVSVAFQRVYKELRL